MNKPYELFIVDDDQDDREFFCEAVARVDVSINCKSATNGVDALEILSNSDFHPDFIFLDLNMPRMSGKQLLKHLKSDERLRLIPVIIFSTSKSTDEIEETKRLGAVHFIIKPSNIGALVTELNGLFYHTQGNHDLK